MLGGPEGATAWARPCRFGGFRSVSSGRGDDALSGAGNRVRYDIGSRGGAPEHPRRRRRLLDAVRLHREGRVDEEELTSAILGTVVGLSAMVAGAHGTLGEVACRGLGDGRVVLGG